MILSICIQIEQAEGVFLFCGKGLPSVWTLIHLRSSKKAAPRDGIYQVMKGA
ncbi:MAG: hypothetical protein ACI8P3_002977 [Saprospiraceae bacterium]|jgi:hypothetical protein